MGGCTLLYSRTKGRKECESSTAEKRVIEQLLQQQQQQQQEQEKQKKEKKRKDKKKKKKKGLWRFFDGETGGEHTGEMKKWPVCKKNR